MNPLWKVDSWDQCLSASVSWPQEMKGMKLPSFVSVMIPCLKFSLCSKLNWGILPETHCSCLSHLCHPPLGDVTQTQLTLHEKMARWFWWHTARFEEEFVKCGWWTGFVRGERVLWGGQPHGGDRGGESWVTCATWSVCFMFRSQFTEMGSRIDE